MFVCCTTTVSALSLGSRRGSALVEVVIRNEAQVSLSPAHSAWLEVWTDDAPLPVSAKRHQQQAAVHDQNLRQLHISIQASSVLDPGKNCNGCDLIIGKPGMLKLGLRVRCENDCTLTELCLLLFCWCDLFVTHVAYPLNFICRDDESCTANTLVSTQEPVLHLHVPLFCSGVDHTKYFSA